MLISITRHKEVFFKNMYLSNKEHDVTTSKTPFLSFLPRECMSKFFLKFFFMYAMPIPVQTKVYFKNFAISCCDV